MCIFEDVYNFEIIIYKDALALLLSDKTDVRAEILARLQQGDPAIEHIGKRLQDLSDELVLNTDKIITKFEEQSCEELMKYISFSEADITFNYSEAVECGDRRTCAFRIACKFDLDEYLKEEADL